MKMDLEEYYILSIKKSVKDFDAIYKTYKDKNLISIEDSKIVRFTKAYLLKYAKVIHEQALDIVALYCNKRYSSIYVLSRCLIENYSIYNNIVEGYKKDANSLGNQINKMIFRDMWQQIRCIRRIIGSGNNKDIDKTYSQDVNNADVQQYLLKLKEMNLHNMRGSIIFAILGLFPEYMNSKQHVDVIGSIWSKIQEKFSNEEEFEQFLDDRDSNELEVLYKEVCNTELINLIKTEGEESISSRVAEALLHIPFIFNKDVVDNNIIDTASLEKDSIEIKYPGSYTLYSQLCFYAHGNINSISELAEGEISDVKALFGLISNCLLVINQNMRSMLNK